MNNKAAVDLLTNSLMFAGTPTDDKGLVSIQSRNNCFPAMLVIGAENAVMYEQFEPLYSAFKELSLNEVNGWHPFDVQKNADMSAIWKMLGRGGDTKCKKNPCHCCAAESNGLTTPSATQCSQWYHNQPDNWFCYHHPIVTDVIMKEKMKELEDLKAALISVIDKVQHSQFLENWLQRWLWGNMFQADTNWTMAPT